MARTRESRRPGDRRGSAWLPSPGEIAAAAVVLATPPAAVALGLRLGIAVALAVLVALTLVGWQLWRTSPEPESNRATLGAGLLVGAVVALAVGYGQFEIDRTVRSIEEQRQTLSQRLAERQNLQLTVSTQRRLSGIDLQGRDLSRFYLRRKDLTTANLAEANLQGADLRESILLGADLRGADLRRAVLVGSDLRAADLSSTQTSHRGTLARLTAAQSAAHDAALTIISGIDGDVDEDAIEARVARLRDRRERIWLPRTVRRRSNATGAFFVGADLRGADLEGADLRNADFTRATLGRAFVDAADLRGARLDLADLRDVDLGGARLEGATVRGANYDNNTGWPTGFNPDAGGARKRTDSE